MNISEMICQIAEALATIRKDAIIGEIKDTEERIYEIVENAIIDHNEIRDIFFEDCEREVALVASPQCLPIYAYACDKLSPNKGDNKSYILQQVININNQYNSCNFYEGYPLKEPPKKFSTMQWLIEHLKWLIDKVLLFFNCR